MMKWIQNIFTKGLIVYIISLAVCFKVWDIYALYNVNHFNYICNTKGQLFESATPGSKVFVRKQHETCIKGENL